MEWIRGIVVGIGVFIALFMVLLALTILGGCGHEPNPVIDVEEAPPPEPEYTVEPADVPPLVVFPPLEEDAGTPEVADAGEAADAGESVDAGEPSDAGPWADCERHQKSQGHGRGLEKSCN